MSIRNVRSWWTSSPAATRLAATSPTLAGQADLVRRIGLRSYMVAPLLARDRLLGVAAFLADDRRYDADDLPLAEELARRIGIAVDNARLFDQARAAADRMSRVQSVTAVLARAPTRRSARRRNSLP